MLGDGKVSVAVLSGVASGIISAAIAGWFATSAAKTSAEAAISAAIEGTYKRELVTQVAPKGVWVMGRQSGQIAFCGLPDGEETKPIKLREVHCTKGAMLGVH